MDSPDLFDVGLESIEHIFVLHGKQPSGENDALERQLKIMSIEKYRGRAFNVLAEPSRGELTDQWFARKEIAVPKIPPGMVLVALVNDLLVLPLLKSAVAALVNWREFGLLVVHG